jgi:hypothetical protein
VPFSITDAPQLDRSLAIAIPLWILTIALTALQLANPAFS